MENVARRILVAEDNQVLSSVLRFNLQHAGFDVTVAEDGGVAFECLERESYDLLLTDYQMPVYSGEQLCKLVRERLQITQMPIVMCSAKGFELDVAQLMNSFHISKVIYKPFSMREIVALAHTLTSTHTAPLTH